MNKQNLQNHYPPLSPLCKLDLLSRNIGSVGVVRSVSKPYVLSTPTILLNGINSIRDAEIYSNRWKEVLSYLKSEQSADLHKDLRPYQAEDVDRILKRLKVFKSCGVFNEPRTGKTPTTLNVIKNMPGNWLILVPTSVLYNWKSEAKRWADIDAVVYHGTKAKRDKITKASKIVVTTYGTAVADRAKLISMGFEGIALDEAHFLRNFRSKQSDVMHKFAKAIPYKLALTGTPTVNKQADMFGILKFLFPNIFTSFYQFGEMFLRDEYSRLRQNLKIPGKNFTGLRTEAVPIFMELKRYISVQRLRSEVMDWIPTKQYKLISLPMEGNFQKQYDNMETAYFAGDDEDQFLAVNKIGALIFLRQFVTMPKKVLNSDKLNISQPKIDWLSDYFNDNEGTPIVVFSSFTGILNELHKAMPEAGIITGETSLKDDEETRIKFQSGKTNILFLNSIKCQTGITLDRAETAIFLDRLYAPSMNEQAEDRIIPTTEAKKDKKVEIIDVIIEGSIEETILTILKDKQEVTAVLNKFKTFKEFKNYGK